VADYQILLCKHRCLGSFPCAVRVNACGLPGDCVVRPSGLAVSSSKALYHVHRAGDTVDEVRKGLDEYLDRHGNSFGKVIIADEPLLRTFLAQPASESLAQLCSVVSDQERLRLLLSKVEFTECAERAGIPIPKFRVLKSELDMPRTTWRGRPTVAKIEESMSGSGVRVAHDANSLQSIRMKASSVR
jgi:glutathione synthase/RimK-type ligase-like ATP-grasp enzyme